MRVKETKWRGMVLLPKTVGTKVMVIPWRKTFPEMMMKKLRPWERPEWTMLQVAQTTLSRLQVETMLLLMTLRVRLLRLLRSPRLLVARTGRLQVGTKNPQLQLLRRVARLLVETRNPQLRLARRVRFPVETRNPWLLMAVVRFQVETKNRQPPPPLLLPLTTMRISVRCLVAVMRTKHPRTLPKLKILIARRRIPWRQQQIGNVRQKHRRRKTKHGRRTRRRRARSRKSTNALASEAEVRLPTIRRSKGTWNNHARPSLTMTMRASTGTRARHQLPRRKLSLCLLFQSKSAERRS
mmetsp:Transcript_19537/g.45670  ORF Transcript_19537/g.45670 Transcript_19537/m.45670 type:complete len:296 (-) Transcript_19537:912-1799(-)